QARDDEATIEAPGERAAAGRGAEPRDPHRIVVRRRGASGKEGRFRLAAVHGDVDRAPGVIHDAFEHGRIRDDFPPLLVDGWKLPGAADAGITVNIAQVEASRAAV